MNRYLIILLAISGCTSSHYTPVDTGMDETLKSCKTIAFKKYNDIHSNDNKSGAVVGGALLGPLGAIIGDGIVGAGNNVQKIDLNAEIQKCMESHGYSGYSSGYN